LNFAICTKKETWEFVCIDKDPSQVSNSFLCISLNIFQASFSVKYESMKAKNYWITQGIKVSYKHKRSLYDFTKNGNDPKARVYYIKYCKIIRKVIKEAMKQHCKRLIPKSNHKITAGSILKEEKGTDTFIGKGSCLTIVNDEKLRIQEIWPVPLIISS
jgi:hypothetical protein